MGTRSNLGKLQHLHLLQFPTLYSEHNKIYFLRFLWELSKYRLKHIGQRPSHTERTVKKVTSFFLVTSHTLRGL